MRHRLAPMLTGVRPRGVNRSTSWPVRMPAHPDTPTDVRQRSDHGQDVLEPEPAILHRPAARNTHTPPATSPRLASRNRGPWSVAHSPRSHRPPVAHIPGLAGYSPTASSAHRHGRTRADSITVMVRGADVLKVLERRCDPATAPSRRSTIRAARSGALDSSTVTPRSARSVAEADGATARRRARGARFRSGGRHGRTQPGRPNDEVGAAADLFVQALLRVVGPDLAPDLVWEAGKRQQVVPGVVQVGCRVRESRLDRLDDPAEPGPARSRRRAGRRWCGPWWLSTAAQTSGPWRAGCAGSGCDTAARSRPGRAAPIASTRPR
jgi:hypothetical protein